MTLSIADRSVTHIFDLIDEGKLGLAESQLTSTLQKFPDAHAVLAAEALLLLKTEQVDKAKEKAEALSQQNVTDGKALNALVHVLQQCCSWDALAQTYERMKGIQNERNVMENLLQTYVRMGAYDKAQKTAMQLYRKWNDPRYQVWIVQSNLSQVPTDATDHILLKVSTKILEGAILVENGLITPSTSRMYVEVLHQQRMYNEAVAFLCSAKGAAVGVPEMRLELLATTLHRNGDVAKANAVAKYLWARRPDNWTFVDMYLNTLSEANAADGVLELDGPDEEQRAVIQLSEHDRTITDALCFCRALGATVTSLPKGRPCRGPFMAELEILSRQGDTQALQQATVAYAKSFYRKACCFLDISTYLNEVSAAAIYAWSIEEKNTEEEEEGALFFHTRRILGLRCHVASWGAAREQQPDHESMGKLLQMCRTSYDESKPLSAQLAWSEEGLCDGYITVALNIILHAYNATRDLQWVEKGILLLDGVDRKANNPVWLMYAVCFARILGLTDIEAWRQLSFKSVQHDTMSHIGYWPLLAGGAVEEICQWNDTAWEYYRDLKKDCGLLRSKVFAFASWPVMKDALEFERRQMNSIAKIICAVHRVAVALRRCQTQRNVLDLMQSEEHVMMDAFAALQKCREAELTDNTDWIVARSMVLGNIHGEKVKTLTDVLIGMPSKAERVDHTRQLLGSLMLLHDIALLEAYRIQMVNVLKSKKKKGKGSANSDVTEIPIPTLLCENCADSLLTLPVISAIAPALLDYVRTRGDVAVIPHTTTLQNSLQTVISSDLVHNFLFPEAFILTTLLQVGTASILPLAAWANDLLTFLRQVQELYSDVSVTTVVGQVRTLREAKMSRMKVLLSDLLRDVLAVSRRR